MMLPRTKALRRKVLFRTHKHYHSRMYCGARFVCECDVYRVRLQRGNINVCMVIKYGRVVGSDAKWKVYIYEFRLRC